MLRTGLSELGHSLTQERVCAACCAGNIGQDGCRFATREARLAEQRPGTFEPELMYKLADAVVPDLATALKALAPPRPANDRKPS